MKIAIAGTGYVGLSLATLLAQRHEVVALDIVPEKVEKINRREAPIQDEYIEKFFAEKKLNLRATLDYQEAFSGADFVIVSTPTNYDPEQDFFDTSSVEDIIEKVEKMRAEGAFGGSSNNEAAGDADVDGARSTDDAPAIVIKSTIPVGFVAQMREKYPALDIFFSPEFLREGRALYDNLYPSRIIVGSREKQGSMENANEQRSQNLAEKGQRFGELLKEASLREDVPVLYMGSTEAEAVKLFANTYLALRVSYFNELDTYADVKGLNAREIIEGVCLDPRVGDFYNNPSFGYGGYCLPKDTKQLLANYENVPQNLIEAIVKANETRKQFIVDEILEIEDTSSKQFTVGIYRLTMKSGSDNFRSSAIQDIILKLRAAGKSVVIYEPTISGDEFEGIPVVHDLSIFKDVSSVILANRMTEELSDAEQKVYTRDLWRRD